MWNKTIEENGIMAENLKLEGEVKRNTIRELEIGYTKAFILVIDLLRLKEFRIPEK